MSVEEFAIKEQAPKAPPSFPPAPARRVRRRMEYAYYPHGAAAVGDLNESSGALLLASLEKRRRRQFWLKLGAVLLVVGGAMALISLLPVHEFLEMTSAWVKQNLLLGSVAVTVVFLVAIPLCVPSAVLETAAGLLFGVPRAFLIIEIGKTGGSLLTFLMARALGKEAIGGYLHSKFPTFRAFSEVLATGSWKPLLLFQLSSIPNLVRCYMLAITHVSALRFAVSSAVGGIPHALLWAYVGDQATGIAAVLAGESEMSTGRVVVLVSSIAVTALAMTFLVLYTRRQLQELQKRECRSSSEESDQLLTIQVELTPSNGQTTPTPRYSSCDDGPLVLSKAKSPLQYQCSRHATGMSTA